MTSSANPINLYSHRAEQKVVKSKIDTGSPILHPPRGRFFWTDLGHPLTADWCKLSSIYSVLQWHWSCATPCHKPSSWDCRVWRRRNFWCFCCCLMLFPPYLQENPTPVAVFFVFFFSLVIRKTKKRHSLTTACLKHIHIIIVIIIIWKLNGGNAVEPRVFLMQSLYQAQVMRKQTLCLFTQCWTFSDVIRFGIISADCKGVGERFSWM